MCLAKDLMTAPATLVGASTGCDEIYRTLAMGVAPGFYITTNVDGLTSRPRLTVQIGDLSALRRFVQVAGCVKIGKSWHAGAGVGGPCTESFEQFLHREFA